MLKGKRSIAGFLTLLSVRKKFTNCSPKHPFTAGCAVLGLSAKADPSEARPSHGRSRVLGLPAVSLENTALGSCCQGVELVNSL